MANGLLIQQEGRAATDELGRHSLGAAPALVGERRGGVGRGPLSTQHSAARRGAARSAGHADDVAGHDGVDVEVLVGGGDLLQAHAILLQ